MILADPKTHKEWLLSRKNGIGGSDAACVLGLNKYKSNVCLWREKTGRSEPADISDKPAVIYGKKAEAPIRELFKLDYPEYDVEYHEFRMYANDKYPFVFATLDGELYERKTGRMGVLEIKTTTIQHSGQWEEWDNRVPVSYYIQVLHQLLATGWDFVVLRAHLKYGQHKTQIRHYFIEKSEVSEDMESLLNAEICFWNSLKEEKEPALILPDI